MGTHHPSTQHVVLSSKLGRATAAALLACTWSPSLPVRQWCVLRACALPPRHPATHGNPPTHLLEAWLGPLPAGGDCFARILQLAAGSKKVVWITCQELRELAACCCMVAAGVDHRLAGGTQARGTHQPEWQALGRRHPRFAGPLRDIFFRQRTPTAAGAPRAARVSGERRASRATKQIMRSRMLSRYL